MKRIRKYDNKDKSIKITSERRGYKLRKRVQKMKGIEEEDGERGRYCFKDCPFSRNNKR